ncbi:hypothetical protein PYCCODRAFT_526887 [Trametes coccinea BRFM310]|uniref:Uncharacterized protein n=1 Tax=Trametes coccinea (strain BRFM310) TaxID=1353009 RepID=A0A1Y2IK39_TRAC3|nr:hypothetical protein PYCCODRAFT_526887 [Trametes coccinea BRFM310]
MMNTNWLQGMVVGGVVLQTSGLCSSKSSSLVSLTLTDSDLLVSCDDNDSAMSKTLLNCCVTASGSTSILKTSILIRICRPSNATIPLTCATRRCPILTKNLLILRKARTRRRAPISKLGSRLTGPYSYNNALQASPCATKC